MDIFGFQESLEGTPWSHHFGGDTFAWSETTPFGHNTTEIFFVITMGLARTTSVFGLLSTPGHILTGRKDCLPTIFPLGASEILRSILVDEELSALNTDAAEDLQDRLVELDVVDGTGHGIVTEMTRALVVVETAGTTELAIFQDPHTRVGKAADYTFLRTVLRDFHDGSSCDLVGAEHAELDANNGFGF
jgi:hypothetical protein